MDSQSNTKAWSSAVENKAMRHLGITMISIGVLVFVSFTKSLAIPRESKADVEALMAFKNAVYRDPYSDCLSNWNSTTSACEWRGLNCSLVQHLWRVSQIDLRDCELNGHISPYLGNLSHLVSLDLCGNNFFGSIPESFSKLFRLEYLDLGTNLLTGTLPTFLSHGNSSDLVSLDLSRNRLSGSIPESFSKLFRLHYLDLSGNGFSGSIPESFSKLFILEYLDLSGNGFSGSIPESFSKLLRLRNLNLASNLLTGRLVLPVSNLEIIEVSHNSLSGSLPISISFMYNLTYMDFSFNNFSGSIPEWISELQNLTIMVLSYNAFSGPIPNAISISSLSSLEEVDFSHNKLTGPLPDWLPLLNLSSSLKEVDFSHNKLTGPLPDWLPLLNDVALFNFSYNDFHGRAPCSHYRGNIYFTGNAKVCGSCLGTPPCKTREHTTAEHKQKHRHHELLLILVGIFGMICFALVIYVSLTRASRKRKSIYGDIGFGNHRLKILSQEDLKAATGGFTMRNFLGEGSYATVYRGVLQDGEIVAVKLFQDFHKKRARKSFLAECHTLGKVRHKNLVRIITACSACSSEDFNALVLEFMPNGSLDRLLHSRAQYMRFSAIDLKTRLRFLTEIAGALSYLHHDCTPAIIHCDVKPQNVLLDGDVCARLSDFGIARLVNDSSGGVTTTLMLKGSIGYIAPEYGVGASVCTRGDVYSFGVTVLEVMTRIKPTDAIIDSSEMGFPRWVSMAMMSKEEMVATLLSREGQEAIHKEDDEEVEKFARLVNLGLICTSLAPEKRPTMRQVHIMLCEFSHEPKDWGNYSLDEILELHLLHRQTTSVSDASSSTFD